MHRLQPRRSVGAVTLLQIGQSALGMAAFVLPFLAVGFAIECYWHRTTLPATTSINLIATAIYVLAVAITSVLLTAWVLRVIAMLPGAGWLPIPRAEGFAAAAASAALWLLIGDGFYYWLHRAEHHFTWLWAQHEVHHADRAMNATTTYRHHWLEAPINVLMVTAPTAYFLQPSDLSISIASVTLTALGFFVHLSRPISFGPWLNRLIATPKTHLVHHSLQPEHFGFNYATVCPLWDVLFSTYLDPTEPITATGVARDVPDTVSTILWHPFTRSYWDKP